MGKNTGTKTGRSESLLLRVPPALKKQIQALADAEGMNMTSWAHRALDRAVLEDAAERRHQEVMAELRRGRQSLHEQQVDFLSGPSWFGSAAE